MNTWFILVMVAACLAGTVLIFLSLRKGAQKKLDYAAFAQAQGWTYEQTTNDLGVGIVDRFRDPGDDWVLEVVFVGGGAQDRSTKRYIEWTTPRGALDRGEAVLGMPLPDKSVAMLQSGNMVGEQILKGALKATLYALGNTRFDLKIDTETAGDPGGMVMSSEGFETAMDGLRGNTDLARFRQETRAAEVPVIIRDERGLSLRRPGMVKDTGVLLAFVRLGVSLRASL